MKSEDFSSAAMAKMNNLADLLVNQVERLIHAAVAYMPYIETLALDMVDAAFAPRQILRQIAMIAFLQISLVTLSTSHRLIRDCLMVFTEKGRKEKKLIHFLGHATSYNEWKTIAAMLDELRGDDQWRRLDHSSLYDVHTIKKRIKSTMEMLQRGDVFDLMFRLRGCLSRDQFGVQHEGLFSRAMAGTKLIVEKYHETMAAALNFICDSPISEEEVPTDAKLAFFNETRHAYGRTALLLSGGAYMGYYHMGVVKALFQEGLMPRVISGASAGSIITAVIGTRTDQELVELFGEPDEEMRPPDNIRTDFFRYSHEFKSEIARRLNYLVPQGLRWLTFPIFSSIFEKKILNLDTEHFKKAMMQNVGLYTFQEAFDRTGRIINITVAPLNSYDPPRLLNYLTAPHVCVWSAAAASCALPGIFDAVSLIVKEPNGQFRPEHEWTRQVAVMDKEEVKRAKLADYSDGSLENDLPMQQLSELFNVNHFIVSQVNPHSAIFSAWGAKATVWSNPIYGALVGYLRFLTSQCRDWLKNIINLLIFQSKAPLWSTRRGLSQTLTQEYEGRLGDVTITPWAGHISVFTALTSAIKNPTPLELVEVFRVGEANTWPSISRIRAHCLIEMTLDKCVQRLRKRITEESERQRVLSARAIMNQAAAAGVSTTFNMDRTPSFYTSRSILNLSGLSVSDPLPLAQQVRRKSGVVTPTNQENLRPSTSQTKLVDTYIFRNPSHDVADITRAEAAAAMDVQEPSHPQQPSAVSRVFALKRSTSDGSSSQNGSSSNSINIQGRQSNNSSQSSFLNLAVPAGHVPLAGQPIAEDDKESLSSSVVTPVQNDDDLLVGTLHGTKKQSLDSSDNLLKEEIYKTTSMANFYYKNDQHDSHGDNIDDA